VVPHIHLWICTSLVGDGQEMFKRIKPNTSQNEKLLLKI
jgi:hypothetical protein